MKEEMMYKVMIMLKWAGEFKTFQEAFEKFFREIKKQAEEDVSVSLRMLMTTYWIAYENFDHETGHLTKGEMYFEDAKEFAYKMGFLSKEGELVNPAAKTPEELVLQEFLRFERSMR